MTCRHDPHDPTCTSYASRLKDAEDSSPLVQRQKGNEHQHLRHPTRNDSRLWKPKKSAHISFSKSAIRAARSAPLRVRR